jgi:hypothetical protein
VTRGGGAAKSQVCAQAPLAFSPLGKNYKKLMKWHLKSRQVAKSLITLKGVAFYNWRVALFFFYGLFLGITISVNENLSFVTSKRKSHNVNFRLY